MYLLLIADRGGGYGGGRDDYGGGGGYGGGGYGGGGCETMRCTEMAAVLSRAARIRTKYTYIYIYECVYTIHQGERKFMT